MKPIMRKRGRRRSLAVPFVMTAALAPGCVVHSGPPQRTSTSQPATEPARHAHNDGNVHVVANPPPPGHEHRQAGHDQHTAPTGPTEAKAEPIETKKRWPAPPTDAEGKVVTRNDGSCWFVYAMPECPPGVACNPPRPKRVQCEDDQQEPEKNDAEGRIVRNDDGTCWYHFANNCPEKATCNPPPPKKVDCPDEE